MSSFLLEAKSISHGFDYPLFRDIDFTIAPQKSAAIVGRSGSGKSTFLHILSTFISPNEGEVTLFNRDIYSLNEEEIESLRRYDIGMIFQFHYLFKGMRALDNIGVAMMLSETSLDEALLEKLQIGHLMNHKSSELSGGEQQRVSIARVLSKKPRIIFADEPTGNLDKETASLVMDVLLEYIERENAALVVVTHDERLAKRCHRLYRLENHTLKEER
jgi:putative ABC transport system ATP-binding protein